MPFDWKALEHALYDSTRQALHALLDQGGAPLYAAALHASYREEDAVLSLPSLAANSRQALDEDYPDEDDQSFSSVKWNPADWRWDQDVEDYASPALLALDAPLQAFANRAGSAQWRSAERRFLVTVARAARALNRHFQGHPGVDGDFVVIFHDFGGDIALARRSISRAQFEAAFPVELALENTRREVAGLPFGQQVTFYIERLDHFDGINTEEAQAWLGSHLEQARPAPTGQLEHPTRGGCVARILRRA